MGTLPEELTKLKSVFKINKPEGANNSSIIDSLVELKDTVGFMSSIRYKKPVVKMSSRKPRRGRVRLFSKKEIKTMEKEKLVESILHVIDSEMKKGNNGASFRLILRKVYYLSSDEKVVKSSDEKVVKSNIKQLQNILQVIKNATNGIIAPRNNQWSSSNTTISVNTLLDMWKQNKNVMWKKLYRKLPLQVPTSVPELPDVVGVGVGGSSGATDKPVSGFVGSSGVIDKSGSPDYSHIDMTDKLPGMVDKSEDLLPVTMSNVIPGVNIVITNDKLTITFGNVNIEIIK